MLSRCECAQAIVAAKRGGGEYSGVAVLQSPLIALRLDAYVSSDARRPQRRVDARDRLLSAFGPLRYPFADRVEPDQHIIRSALFRREPSQVSMRAL